MKLTFTKTYLKKNKGCYTLKQVNNLSFINNKVITIEDILKSEINISDKLWVLWKIGDFNYNLRLKMYNNSKKLQTISGGAWVLSSDDWACGLGCPAGLHKTILLETLKFIKKEYR